MFKGAYSEEELVQNRSAVLLYGGTPNERRAWAEEVATAFPAARLVPVSRADELSQALALRDAVVLVEDLVALGDAGQAQIIQCLLRQEERPKLVLGLKLAADTARAQGLLRDDLHFRLQIAKVDLDAESVRQAIQKRRPNERRGADRKKAEAKSPARKKR